MSDFKYSLTNLKPVESQKIALTFPDGATREFPSGTTGFEIAKGISPSLASARWRWRSTARSPISPRPSRRTRRSNSSPATMRARWS